MPTTPDPHRLASFEGLTPETAGPPPVMQPANRQPERLTPATAQPLPLTPTVNHPTQGLTPQLAGSPPAYKVPTGKLRG